jgi:hypothetical protein
MFFSASHSSTEHCLYLALLKIWSNVNKLIKLMNVYSYNTVWKIFQLVFHLFKSANPKLISTTNGLLNFANYMYQKIKVAKSIKVRFGIICRHTRRNSQFVCRYTMVENHYFGKRNGENICPEFVTHKDAKLLQLWQRQV